MKQTLLIITALMLVVGCSSPEPILKEGEALMHMLREKNGLMYIDKYNSDSTLSWEEPFSGKAVNFQDKIEVSYKDEKKDGLWTDLHENGQKYEEGIYKDGEKDGKWTQWHWNGQKMSERTYKDGEDDGKLAGWHFNGQKSSEGTYKDGKRDGLRTYWWDNGQKEEEGTYKDGEPDGLHTEWYENGQKVYEITYKDGVVISGKCWDEDGNECECSRYSKYQWRGCN